MLDSPSDLIEETAKANGIELENASPDCLLFVYSLTFKASQKTLEKKFEAISKRSIESIKSAFEKIHIQFGYLKEKGEIKGKKYSDVEHISPLMETVLGQLTAVLGIYEQMNPPPPLTPEKLRLRSVALQLCGEALPACRRHVSEINNKIGWWCKEEKAKVCQDPKSAQPSPPTNIEEKKRKQKFA